MLLYANGDSHTAAAEAINTLGFACDDPRFQDLGLSPHPDNARVSWCQVLANDLSIECVNQSQAASSNTRIRRVTREWISNFSGDRRDLLVILQWSTWERQEWWHDRWGWAQVTASGTDTVPREMRDRYREYVASVDWNKCTQEEHAQIWDFHVWLKDLGIRHVFFNGNTDFSIIGNPRYRGMDQKQQDWGNSYIGPYDPKFTYNQWLRDHGHKTVNVDSWHFGPEAHRNWAGFVLQYIKDNNILGNA